MLKVLGKLGKLAKLADVLDDLILLGFRLLEMRSELEEAPNGASVDLGELRGVKLFGDTYDFPLIPFKRA